MLYQKNYTLDLMEGSGMLGEKTEETPIKQNHGIILIAQRYFMISDYQRLVG